jgi:hypothetical protein
MQIALRSSTFRICAVVAGLVGLGVTVLLYSVFLVSIGAGIAFGTGGWLFDWYTDFRLLNQQLSSWAFAVGGGVVALYWRSNFVPFSPNSLSPWPSEFQYIATVLMCWGVLMFAFPRRVIDRQS